MWVSLSSASASASGPRPAKFGGLYSLGLEAVGIGVLHAGDDRSGTRILDPLVEPKRREIAVLVERLDRRALFLAGKKSVRLRGQEVANLFRNGAVGGIERCQRIRRGRLLRCGRRIGRSAVRYRRRLVRRGCGRGSSLRCRLLGRCRCHGRGGELIGVLRHAAERGGKDQGQRRTRQDAVITWATHRRFSPRIWTSRFAERWKACPRSRRRRAGGFRSR